MDKATAGGVKGKEGGTEGLGEKRRVAGLGRARGNLDFQR